MANRSLFLDFFFFFFETGRFPFVSWCDGQKICTVHFRLYILHLHFVCIQQCTSFYILFQVYRNHTLAQLDTIYEKEIGSKCTCIQVCFLVCNCILVFLPCSCFSVVSWINGFVERIIPIYPRQIYQKWTVCSAYKVSIPAMLLLMVLLSSVVVPLLCSDIVGSCVSK